MSHSAPLSSDSEQESARRAPPSDALSIALYFPLTFALTWTLWFLSGVRDPSGPRGPLFLLGAFSPGIVALVLTGFRSGRREVRTLLQRLIDWHVPARWLAFAAGYMLVIKLTVALLYRVAAGTWPRFGDEPLYLMVAATLWSTMIGGQAGEELGWRGYALPRLAERLGMRTASIVLGAAWALLHLPLFFAVGADTFGQSFLLYALQVTAISVVMTWLYAHTRGSLFPVMLLHAAVNNTKDIVPSAEHHATSPWVLSHSPVGWMTVGLLWLSATYFLVRMPRMPALAAEAAG